MPSASVTNEEMYGDLRDEEEIREKPVLVSNGAVSNGTVSNGTASRGRSSVARRSGRSGSYDAWTVVELKKRAKELGLTGYSGLSKDKLIDKLRSH